MKLIENTNKLDDIMEDDTVGNQMVVLEALLILETRSPSFNRL
jgi:hypothetical protein